MNNNLPNLIEVTESAKKHIFELIQEEKNPKGVFFRIAVKSGGCSGFQYDFSLDANLNEDDLKISENVVIDQTSIDFLQNENGKGSRIDFVEDLGSCYFTIRNPIATANCGCGNSFSI